MNSHKIALKLYAAKPSLPDSIRFVEVFHDWIKKGTLSELMIDVIEYGHVAGGPLVLFIGHESDYAIDISEGRVGLSYLRKRVTGDGAEGADSLADAFRRLLFVADRLGDDARLAGLEIGRTEVLLRVLDRLNAPNVPATFERERGEIERAAANALGSNVTLSHELGDPREAFAVRIRSAATPS